MRLRKGLILMIVSTPIDLEQRLQEIEARANAANSGALLLPRVVSGSVTVELSDEELARAEPLPTPFDEATVHFTRHAKADTAFLLQTIREQQEEIERLRGICRGQRETIKHWQRHVSVTSKLLGCGAMDSDVEEAIRELYDCDKCQLCEEHR